MSGKTTRKDIENALMRGADTLRDTIDAANYKDYVLPIPMPKVYIRKMATMWGSCSIKRGAVVFNLYLLKAKIACIDYVVLHELTHFLYPNHSKQFYYFLSNYMPDWKVPLPVRADP